MVVDLPETRIGKKKNGLPIWKTDSEEKKDAKSSGHDIALSGNSDGHTGFP